MSGGGDQWARSVGLGERAGRRARAERLGPPRVVWLGPKTARLPIFELASFVCLQPTVSVWPTRTLTGRGERMRASGPVERDVMRPFERCGHVQGFTSFQQVVPEESNRLSPRLSLRGTPRIGQRFALSPAWRERHLVADSLEVDRADGLPQRTRGALVLA